MLISVEELSDMKMYQDVEKYTEKLYSEEDADLEDIFFSNKMEGAENNYGYEQYQY